MSTMTPGATTILYTHPGGRLGNQLIRFVHWLAWLRTQPRGVTLVNAGFWRYARFFRVWAERPACDLPDSRSAVSVLARAYARLPEVLMHGAEWRLQRGLHAVVRAAPGGGAIELDDRAGESLDLATRAAGERLAAHRLVACRGWKIGSWALVARDLPGLRDLFQPHRRWEREATEFIGALRRRHDLVVGLQIRQSDYRTWNAGRFFFPSSCYVAWLQQLLELYPGQRVAVVVASEERQDPAWFAGLPIYFAPGSCNAGGEWFTAWVVLSQCDMVLGPPSTFSTSAAFVGGIPLWPVAAENQVLATAQVLPNALLDAHRHPAFGECVQ